MNNIWKFFSLSASDDVSFFRTSCLQNLFSSDALSFLLADSIALIFSSEPMLEFKDTKFSSMVLHTWTNINISNWQFLIPCYHQNSKGNVKHILFQQWYPSLFFWSDTIWDSKESLTFDVDVVWSWWNVIHYCVDGPFTKS